MMSNRSLHVVIFIPSIETGGVERNAILVANHFAGLGYRTSVVYRRMRPVMRVRFERSVAMIQIGRSTELPLVNPRLTDAALMLAGCVRFLKAQKRQGPVVVLSFQSNIIGIIAARLVGLPAIARVSSHPVHASYEKGKLRKISEKLKLVFYRYAAAVISNSEVTSDYYRARLPTPVYTIYNPVDLQALREMAKREPEHPWLLNRDIPVVIAVGRLARQKNFSMLVDAFRKVVDKVDARLIIVGEGEERRTLEVLVKDLGLDERVDLPGYSANVPGMVSRADLFVLSSLYEGLPNALQEAIAVDTPAVSTDCLSGPSELLCQGAGGDLVPVGDVDALAEVIANNLLNRQRALELLGKAREKLGDYEQHLVMASYENIVVKAAGVGKNAI